MFQSDRDGNAELYMIDPFTAGAMPERLTNNPANDVFPVWQPVESWATITGLTGTDALGLIRGQR